MERPAPTVLSERCYRAMLDTLDRLNYGALILDESLEIASINATGTRILKTEARPGTEFTPGWGSQTVRRMLKCAPPSFQFTENAWFMILREDRRPLLVQAIPLHCDPSLQAMLIFVDPDSTAQPNPKGLERIFGLTPAEARLAVQLCLGERLADIARANDASLAITRSQLAGVYGKTQTQRRTELVLLLSRLSILP